MAGTALAAGVLTVAATLSLGLAAVGGAAVTAQRTAGAADAAALAAADSASGAVITDEDPCGLAVRVAAASGATYEVVDPDAVPRQVAALNEHRTQVTVVGDQYALSNDIAARLSGREGYAELDLATGELVPAVPGSARLPLHEAGR